jgi:hypothetical protein
MAVSKERHILEPTFSPEDSNYESARPCRDELMVRS